MNEKQMHRDATLEQLAKTVASLQSFEYDTFDAARETVKIERPDFVLGNSGEIGIEVTRLTTESESVMRRISKENFGKGRTAADIRENAKKVHGGKAENYSYFDLGEAVAVGESLVDLSERYKMYSERIVNKYHKYKEISEEILALAKETEPNLGGFTLCILRTDSDGKSEVDSFCL